jgi:DNA-binding transcriptional LysR family regulator
MANLAHTIVGSNLAGSSAPSAGVGIRSKVYQLSPPGRVRPSDDRDLHCEGQQQRPTFTTKEIGLDSLAALNVFVRAAESCSFTDAGGQLGLSSSAVGKCVARLEQRLGVRLFHRNTRCINLTQEGNALLESCRRIFLEIRSVEQELAQAKGAPKGKLRVSMPLNGMQMVPTLGNFIRAYPEVELDIDFTDSIVDVVDGGYDVVLRSGEVGDSRLKSRRLGAYRFEIVGSPNYFTRAGMPTKPEDLVEHACLHRKHPTTGKIEPWPFAQSITVSDFILPTTATASTLDALIYLAESDMGIACVPNFCVRRQIADGTLISVLKGCIERIEVVRAMWPSSQFQSPKLRVFIDFVAENLLSKLSLNPKAHEFATVR